MWFSEVQLFEKAFIKARLMGHNSINFFIEEFKWIVSPLSPQENPTQRKLFGNKFPF